jgi:hypothetical protein
MTLRDIGPERAKALLREACAAQKVRSRQLVAPQEQKLLVRRSLGPHSWSSWNAIDVDRNSLHTLDSGELEYVEVNEQELRALISRPRRGPVSGKVARYEADDRALFRAIKLIMHSGNKSVTEAVRDLESEGKIKGRGTAESRILRVARLYRKQRS